MIVVGPLRVSISAKTIEKDGAAYPISDRAFAILEALIDSRGTLVSKDVLIERAWPDTIVEENNLQVQVNALRRALGSSRELLRTVVGRGYLLLPEPQRTVSQSATWSRGLPFVDTLFGRDEAMAELLSLLPSHPVITLVGAGGIGKTSLAVELCRNVANRFECIRFLQLAPISTEREAHEAVLSLFSDFTQGSAVTLNELAEHLASSECLLVLDNCEHLIDTAALIAMTLTSGNPGVRIIATSRESLRVASEWLYPVNALSCPSLSASCAEMLATDAVQLFLHRMRRLSVNYEENQLTLGAISDICRRLDGLPLAIELAAARATTLGLDTVRKHLDDRFSFLTGGSKDVLPRHQTLRAVFEWSYMLLPEVEKIVFRQTGIFVDGFTLDAVLCIISRWCLTFEDVAGALAGLVAKSLLVLDHHNPRRFRQLESARAYALALQEHNGEANATSRAHAAFFQRFFETGIINREGLSIADMVAIFDVEKANLRAALAWAFGPDGSEDLGLDLASTAVPLLYDLSWLGECTYWATVALNVLEKSKLHDRLSPTRLKLLSAYAAALAYTEGPDQTVYDMWSEALEGAKVHNDSSGQLRAIWGLWNSKQYAGEPILALDHAQQFSVAARTHGGVLHAALGRRLIGISLHYAGQHRRANNELLAALSSPELAFRRWTTTGVRIDQIAVTKATLARTQWFMGDTTTALLTAADAENASREAGHETTLAYVLIEATIPLGILECKPMAVLQGVRLLQDECRRAGLQVWLQCCDAFEWIAHAQQMPLDARDLRNMERATSRLFQTGYLAPLPLVLGEYAKALNANGQSQEAMTVTLRALEHCEERRSWWYFRALNNIRRDISV